MRDRDYPVYASFPRRDTVDYFPPVNPVRSTEEWGTELATFNAEHQADIDAARIVGAEIAHDVHLYRKIGSPFIGIGFAPGTGPTVKFHLHPEIKI